MFFFFFLRWLFREAGLNSWKFLVTILFLFLFLFFSKYLTYYLARDSCKKWQEIIDKQGLISRIEQLPNFLVTSQDHEKDRNIIKTQHALQKKHLYAMPLCVVFGAEKGFSRMSYCVSYFINGIRDFDKVSLLYLSRSSYLVDSFHLLFELI